MLLNQRVAPPRPVRVSPQRLTEQHLWAEVFYFPDESAIKKWLSKCRTASSISQRSSPMQESWWTLMDLKVWSPSNALSGRSERFYRRTVAVKNSPNLKSWSLPWNTFTTWNKFFTSRAATTFNEKDTRGNEASKQILLVCGVKICPMDSRTFWRTPFWIEFEMIRTKFAGDGSGTV